MIKKIILTAACTWLSSGAAFAAWNLVDDMNYADQAAMDAVWSPYPIDAADGDGGGAEVATDPADAGNKVLKMVSGLPNGVSTGAFNNFATRSLPAGSEIATLGTVYFRAKVPTVPVGGSQLRAVVDLVWGVGTRRPIADPLNPDPVTEVVGSYNDLSVLARQEFDESYDVFDLGNPAGTYQTVLTNGLVVDAWYDMWYVCDHANNAFRMYAQGPGLGNGTEQVLVYPFDPDTHPPTGWSNERSPSLEPLRSFMLYSSSGTGLAPKGLDYMFIDDIYVDNTGINLTSPLTADESGSVINISTRGLVGTGGDVMIGGFIITGGSRTVLIRGIGPALIPPPYNLANALTDVEIELYDSTSMVIASNDDWSSSTDAAAIQAATLQYTGFPLPNPSLDAAILINLPAGSYTVFLKGKGTTTGVGLIEVYDAAD